MNDEKVCALWLGSLSLYELALSSDRNFGTKPTYLGRSPVPVNAFNFFVLCLPHLRFFCLLYTCFLTFSVSCGSGHLICLLIHLTARGLTTSWLFSFQTVDCSHTLIAFMAPFYSRVLTTNRNGFITKRVSSAERT